MLLRHITRRLSQATRTPLSYVGVRNHNFEADDNMTAVNITMLSQENETNTYIEAYSIMGFKLNSGFRIIGPLAVFPRSILSWNVRGSEDISPDSLSLFTLLEPKLDLLIIGIGDTQAKYDKTIIKYLRSHKINVEILPTDRACATFNFLNAERRCVAGALIPPTYMQTDYDENMEIREQMEREKLYQPETGEEKRFRFQHDSRKTIEDDETQKKT